MKEQTEAFGDSSSLGLVYSKWCQAGWADQDEICEWKKQKTNKKKD